MVSPSGLLISNSTTYFHHSSFQLSNITFINPLPFQETVFSSLPLQFRQHIFITPASMSATLVSSNPLLFQETFFSLLPLPFLQNIFITPASMSATLV